jgi:hypothetical protein
MDSALGRPTASSGEADNTRLTPEARQRWLWLHVRRQLEDVLGKGLVGDMLRDGPRTHDGVEGVKWMIEEAETSKRKLLYTHPDCPSADSAPPYPRALTNRSQQTLLCHALSPTEGVKRSRKTTPQPLKLQTTLTLQRSP